jgi:hypothetical protein
MKANGEMDRIMEKALLLGGMAVLLLGHLKKANQLAPANTFSHICMNLDKGNNNSLK